MRSIGDDALMNIIGGRPRRRSHTLSPSTFFPTIHSAVDLLVEDLAAPRQTGDDEASIAAHLGGLDAGDDLLLAAPRSGLAGELVHAAHLLGPAGLATPFALLAPGRSDGIELHIDRQAEDVVAAQMTQQIEHFRGAMVGVGAHQDAHAGPAPANAADHVPEHARDLLARGPLAGAQQRQDRLAGVAFEDVDPGLDPGPGSSTRRHVC